MWIVTDFMRQIGNVQHFSSERTPLITSPDQQSWKRWRWRWFSCAEDDPKFSWQRCFSLALISCLTKWPFSLHSDIMESYIMQLTPSSASSERRADWTWQNCPPVCFFLKSLQSGESRWFLLSSSIPFFLSLSTNWARIHIYLASVMQWQEAW